jgi:RNase P/RNase MRP subunit POP5
MAIKKSLRKGGRYILFKQHYENKPKTESEIILEIKKNVGLIDAPPIKMIHYDKDYGLIKTNNSGLKKVLISLILYSERENRIEILDSSGTIKSIVERNPEIEKRIKKN